MSGDYRDDYDHLLAKFLLLFFPYSCCPRFWGGGGVPRMRYYYTRRVTACNIVNESSFVCLAPSVSLSLSP